MLWRLLKRVPTAASTTNSTTGNNTSSKVIELALPLLLIPYSTTFHTITTPPAT